MAKFLDGMGRPSLSNDLALGVSQAGIMAKYGLSEAQYSAALSAYLAGDPLDIVPPAPGCAREIIAEAIVPPRGGYHYRAEPRGDNVFLLVVDKGHSSQIIIPDAHKEKSDVGFVWAVGPLVKDLKRGDMCLFDKFSTVGQSYSLLDEDGEEKEFLMLREVSIVAVLHREKRKGPLGPGVRDG